MKFTKRFCTLILTLSVLLQLFVVSASAASASLSVSSSTLSIGDTLTVTVTMSNGSSAIGVTEGFLSFNSSVLEYTSGSNTNLQSGSKVKMVSVGDGSATSSKFTIKFKCKAAGTSSLSLSGTVVDFVSEADSSVSASRTVTVKSAEPLSSDATLKSLVGSYGSLTPSFSSSVTSYSVTVPNSVTVYTITAQTNHSGAKTSYTGSKNLSVGVNTRSVTVTAEDGVTKKTYTIKITRQPGASTSSNSTSTTVTSSESPSSNTSSEFEFTIGENGYNIMSEWPADTKLPSGFFAIEYSYGKKQIAALKSHGEMMLIYASDAYGNNKFVIYNEDTKAFSEFYALEYNGNSYILIDRDRTDSVPVGFSSTKADLLGRETTVWTDASGRMLIYAIDSNGEKGFYLYNKETGVIEKYSQSVDAEPLENESENKEHWLDKYKNNNDALFKTVVIETIIIAVLLIISVTFITLYALKCRKNKTDQ